MISDHVFLNAVMSSNSLTDESKRSYMKHLRQVQKNTPVSIGTSFYKMLLHPKEVMAHIRSLISSNKISLNTGKANIVALAMLIRRMNEAKLATDELKIKQPEWVQNVHSINKRVTDLLEKNSFSKREEKSWVDHNQWLKKEKELRATEEGSESHLLVAFHSLIAPPRGGDLFHVKIISSKTALPKSKLSVLIWDGPDKPATLLIRDHKTRKTWPVVKQDLPEQLRKSIDISLKENPRTTLFSPTTRGSFINWKNREFQRLFNKAVTSNIARHAYVNFKESKPRSISTKRDDAAKMGHSISTHDGYRKLSK